MEQTLRRSARLSRSPVVQSSPMKRRSNRQTPKGSIEKMACWNEKPKKNRRRSSMNRRSLVATLECIQSNEISNTTEGLRCNESKKFVKDTDTTNIADAPFSPSRSAVPAQIEKASTETPNLSMSTDISSSLKSNSRIVRLKAERTEWILQRKIYKNLQNETNKNLQSVSIKNLITEQSHYLYYHEQISDIEDRFSSALTVISKAMSTIERLKDLHTIKLNKQSKEAFDIAFKKRQQDDPRILIEKILFLHNDVFD